MRILLTGSSGWLGQSLAPRLRALGHAVIGLDPVASPQTRITGSVADRALVRAAIGDHRIQAVIHAGALHQPDMARRPRQDFIDVNVTGTLNLLEESAAQGVQRMVFTSTTSLMISDAIRAGIDGGARRAAWLTEAMVPEPRNIYGASKFAAETLCRLMWKQTGLPVVVLRTARFFPEADDMAHTIEQSDANTKANELLYRRLTAEDAAEAHVAALDKAPGLGFGLFIISAPPPFSPDDAEALIADAPAVVERYFPHYREIYDRLGWTMFRSIDRVYDPSLAKQQLGFVCKTGFGALLDQLAAETA